MARIGCTSTPRSEQTRSSSVGPASIQTIQQECLDHFVILGQRHFDHLVRVWLEHYHNQRPHQAKENALLMPVKAQRRTMRERPIPPNDVVPLSEIRCEQRLGGLLKHYYRKAG